VPIAVECRIWPSIQSIRSRVESSKLHDSIVSSEPLQAYHTVFQAETNDVWLSISAQVLRDGHWESCLPSPHTLQTRQSPYTKQRCATPNKMHSSTARLMTCSERTRPGMPEIASGQSTAKPCQRCERPFHECSTIKRCSAAMARTHRTRAASPGSKRRTAMARRTSPPSRHMLVK
jgi:hypothetical protein